MAFDSMMGTPTFFRNWAWVYGIKTDLWDAAMRSYQKNYDDIKKPHLITVVDYRITSNKPRLWTLNFSGQYPQLICNTLVSHGKGSGKWIRCNAVSNETGSAMSAVGGWITKHIFQSKLGQKDEKRRPALVISGRDATNWGASKNRGIHMHGAHYVSDKNAGYSRGCLTTKQSIHEELIKIIQGGSFVFTYFGEESIEV